MADRRSWNKLARRGLDPEEIDNQMAMIVGLHEAAVRGDARAGRLIVDILGEDNQQDDTAVTAKEDALSRSLRALGEELDSDD